MASPDLGKFLERSPEGYHALSWVLYGAAIVIAASSLADVSGTLLLIGCIAVIVLASTRRKEAEGTLYASHLANVLKVMTVDLIVGLVLMAITFLTLGIGIIITWPAALIMLAWSAWRLIGGMMKLNDGVAY